MSMDSPGGPLEGTESGYSAKQRCVNIAGLGVFLALTLRAALELIELGRDVPGALGLALLAIVLALPAADFLSGLVHWAADNWGSADWPFVGGFVGPFRHHHVEPEAMTQHGFLRRFGDNVVAALPTFWFATLADGDAGWRVFAGVFWVAVAYWILATAQFHVWAHCHSPPRVARWLQRAGLILAPDHHAVHHQAPHASHYCITTGWCDGILQRLRFFSSLERLITFVTGAQPRHAAQELASTETPLPEGEIGPSEAA